MMSKGGRPRQRPVFEELVQTTLRLPVELHTAAKVYCAQRRIGVSDMLKALLERELGRRSK